MNAAPNSLVIVIPSYNDWESLRLLLPILDRTLVDSQRRTSVLVVDDASTEPLPQNWPGKSFRAIESVEILHLRCNLGHQRAIALGLYQVHEFLHASAVVIMDADGEDRAEDVATLLAEFDQGGEGSVVFAARTKRMEGLAFRFCYQAYRTVHRMLTGVEVRVGNFSVVSRAALTRLMAASDLWNHYAAAVHRAKLPRRTVPLARGARLAGESKMNLVSLLVHGLTAMSVFSDQVSARLLAASAGFAALALGIVAVTVGVGSLTGLATRGWAIYAIGTLLGLVLQLMTFATLFAFMIVSRRSSVSFILQRDAPYFILGKTAAAGQSQLAQLARALEQEEPPVRAAQ